MGDGDRLWFGRKDSRLGFGPLTWEGRVALWLYLFLVVVAVVVYATLGLTLFVIAFYTVVLALLVAVKSDLLKGWPPER